MMKNLKSKFDFETEKAYIQNEIQLSLKLVRILLIVFSILYAFFSITDYFLVNDHLFFFTIIRFCIVIPIFIITILLSFIKSFVSIYQRVMLINYIFAGLGISVMLIIKPNNLIYYGGMFMIYFSGYLLIKLNFKYALIGGWGIQLFYFLGSIIFHGRITDNLIYSSMFFIGANIIGMVGSYDIELSSRKNFQNNLIINECNNELEKQLVNKSEEINTLNLEIVFVLAKLAEARDKYTGKHLENVGKYCYIIAEEIDESEYIENGYSSKQNFMSTIRLASSLHDIGKVGINDYILNKNGKFTDEEFCQMKTHSVIGSEILEKVQSEYPYNAFINMGVLVTRSHHERFDGLGYPDRLKGKDIPLCARIIGLCDTYDALTSERPYKEAYSHSSAIEIIKNEGGKQFDPEIVEIFLKKQKRFFELL